jgi:hypothetical protein
MPLSMSLLILVLGCGSDESPTEQEVSSTEGLAEFYTELQGHADSFGFKKGQWTEDFGDAAAFGPAFYSNAGIQMNRKDYVERANEAAAYNLEIVNQGGDDFLWLGANLEEAFMATQGLISWAGVTQNMDSVDSIDGIIDMIDPMVVLTGDYLNLDLGEFSTDLYGPTSTTGGVAVIYLQHAGSLNAERSPEWLQRAVEIAASIEEVAYDGDHYKFSPDVDKLYLYPNATMLMVLTGLYEQTGDLAYLDRAEEVYQGIQPLWNEEMELYHSPYSVESQGAQTDEYSTLSSQNYLMLGLMELYHHSGDTTYLNDVIRLLKSVKTRLYSPEDGLIVHHWIDGRPATHDDPDFFCSGCNLQTLYILWYLQNVLGVALT